MAKGKDKNKKLAKKAPLKTMKEKKQDKIDKKREKKNPTILTESSKD